MATDIGVTAFDCITIFGRDMRTANKIVEALRSQKIDPHKAFLRHGLRLTEQQVRLTFVYRKLLFCVDVPTS
jgi:hypothetical protein